MPFRLLPVAVILTFVVLLALGIMNDESDDDRASADINWHGTVENVNGVLDNALTQDSFDWLHDSVADAAEGVERSVDGVNE